MRDAVQTTIISALGAATSPDLRTMCLWSATVCIFENVTHFPFDSTFLARLIIFRTVSNSELVTAILICAGNEDLATAKAALQCLTTLAAVNKKLHPVAFFFVLRCNSKGRNWEYN